MTPANNPTKYLGNEAQYLRRVLDSENWSATSGSWTSALEQAFATRMGTSYAVAMNSGTSTLHAALEAVGVGPGDEVISPALTVIMDTTATLHANAIPVFADVLEDTFNVDPEDVERKITPRTKAIVAVALYGLPADLGPLREIADRYGIALIEDNAQCVLAEYRGRLVGGWGDVASWSFENTKHLSAGEGGMVTTESQKLAVAMRKLGGHGFKNLTAQEGRVRLNQDVFQDPDYKRHDVLGWNYRMPEFTAAVALAQLERAEDLVAMRQTSAMYLLEALDGCPFLTPQALPDDRTNSFYTLGVRFLSSEAHGWTWQGFRRAYIDRGGDGIYGAWAVPYLEPVISEGAFRHRNPAIYADVDYEPGMCPVAERVQPTIMQLKTNYRDGELAKEKAKLLKDTIDDVLGS